MSTPSKLGVKQVLMLAVACAAIWLQGCGGGGDEAPAEANTTPKGVWALPATDLLSDLSAFNVPLPSPLTISNQTVRQAITLVSSGEKLRLKLSNVYGTSAVKIAKVTAALGTEAGVVTAGTSVPVSFNGSSSVTIPAGTEIWSEPFALRATAGNPVNVDLFINDSTSITTGRLFQAHPALVTPGDQSGTAVLAGATTATARFMLTEVDAFNPLLKRVVVAFGDSITEGTGGSRYTTYLQQRFDAGPPQAGSVAVVNQGIGGNRWLRDRFGPSGVSRLQRDVLDVSGITDVVMLMGINDIQLDAIYPEEKANADQIISAISSAISRAKNNEIKVFLGTILPWGASVYYSEERESVRASINSWIRSNTDIDGLIDFDKALQDPSNPNALNPIYDSGDHVHPNQAGYQKMADTFDLTRF
ncbi:MAG TPA: GDSL-type esterase/lipase family protein [Candidatus Sulfotelmatobacter sp.]|nr:GDSL-type esterase/lipase family protein [Candidatus Sulfotelmatobacter sp.]